MKEFNVVAAVVFRDNKILATQRGYGENKGKWEFPGGKIDEGETHEQALIREVREELDMEIEVHELIKTLSTDFPNFHLNMHCYKATIKKGEPKLLEHDDACWVDKSNIDKLDWSPADLDVIEDIKALL